MMLLEYYFQYSNNFKIIQTFYGTQRAKRSQVPLINHILEGVVVLNNVDNTLFEAYDAYALHPIFQTDDNLVGIFRGDIKGIDTISQKVIALSMEYRRSANSYLSTSTRDRYLPSPLPGVKEMLIADKVQNRKDFEQYHLGTHLRSKELDAYFHDWMDILGISETEYEDFCELIDSSRQKYSKWFLPN